MTEPTCTRHVWSGPDGQTFPYSHWPLVPPNRPARAIVVAVHGLSGAALDFEPLASHLQKHEIETFALELRGQGNDPVRNRRGDLIRVEDWYADLSAFISPVRERNPGVPIFYYGESMGAALLARYLAQAPIEEQPAGLVLASPVVTVPGRPSWWQQAIFRFFLVVRPTHRINVTKFTKRDKDDPAKWVTRDEAHRRWFETAPHKLEAYTIRFFKNLFELIEGCFAAAPMITVPLLVVYAAHDVFIPPARVEEFFAKLGSKEKELQFFPGSYHLLLHDYDKGDALARIESWLLKRIGLIEGSAVASAAR